jgi:hypothetical protein
MYASLGWPRRTTCGGCVANRSKLAVGSAAVVAMLVTLSHAASAASPGTVGAGDVGHTAYEMVGKIHQDGDAFQNGGYVTHIAGLDDAFLFAGSGPSARTAATARFTFVSTATFVDRSILDNVIVVRAHGTTTFYFSETPAGASFDDLSTFSAGTPIATVEGDYQDVNDVREPHMGVVVGQADLVQGSVHPFTLNGRTYRFGAVGQAERLLFTGSAVQTPPTSDTLYGASVMVAAGAGTGSGAGSTGTSKWAYAAFALGALALLLAGSAFVTTRRRFPANERS